MAKILVCDICGSKCIDSGRYKLIYKSLLRDCKYDICYECVSRIKNETKKDKDKLNLRF